MAREPRITPSSPQTPNPTALRPPVKRLLNQFRLLYTSVNHRLGFTDRRDAPYALEYFYTEIDRTVLRNLVDKLSAGREAPDTNY